MGSRKRSHIKKNPTICIVSFIRRISIPNLTAVGTTVFEIRLLQTHVPPQNLFVGPLYYNWHQAPGTLCRNTTVLYYDIYIIRKKMNPNISINLASAFLYPSKFGS